MKKKQIANLTMVAIILVIVAAGILGVGHIQGWFDTDDGTYAVLRDMRGTIHLERDGVSYPVEDETVLRAGNQLSCDPGATAVIQAGDNTFTIGEKASLTITDPATESFCAEILSGEVFADCENDALVAFSGKQIELSQTTALISVRTGAQSISVLRGQVESAAAGQILNYVGEEESVGKLDINSLNDFTITQIRGYDGDVALCFTEEDLDQLITLRQQALQELINSQTKPSNPGTEAADPTTGTTVPGNTTESTDPTTGTASPGTERTDPTQSETTVPPTTEKPTESTTPPTTTPPTTETTASTFSGGSCTITIRCDTILNNMDELEPGKVEFVPSDGVILYPVTVQFEAGETVFDVLTRVCDITGIQIEYSWTPLYGSYYIEGINNLYEFDCGNESGWMYKVNGWFPNYGCSSYTLKDGDVIVWAYTCHGLGTDVGAPEWTG